MSERLLIAASEAGSSPYQLPGGVRLLIDAADEITVLSPRLPSRLEWLASDTDKAKQEADQRLRTVLGQLEEVGVEVEGTVGADDPLQAFEDAVARFSPTHILVGLRSQDRADWQENGLIDGLWERIRLPITVFDLSDD